MYELLVTSSLEDWGSSGFAELEAPLRFPFLRYEWLSAFEKGGCLGAERGWLPRHLVVKRGRELVAFAPAYIKLNSFGEFVFDHTIAEYAESRLGVHYYPKLVLGVPFTPATGPRVLFVRGAREEDRWASFDLFSQGIAEICENFELSSAHALFPDVGSSALFGEAGWLERSGVQFQFHNEGYPSFEEFLGSFRAKRRAAIRRERRIVEASGLTVRQRTGEELSRVDPRLVHELYLTTVDKYVWGRRYLTRSFFELVLSTMPEVLHLVTAEDKSGEVVAGAFNLLGEEALYGRYWGAFREEHSLHFELCLYRGIEETLRLGLARFEPGAGGEHKESRGFRPTLTRSFHYFRDPRLAQVVSDFYERERSALREHHPSLSLDPEA